MLEPHVTIREFATSEEMRACEHLQREVWQYSETEVVPHSLFVVALKTGGDVLGAFNGDRPIGFSLAFPAMNPTGSCLHSHMTAVLPEYQNQGVGRSLKLAQRKRALARGIHLIEWTFDALQLRNAHFNVARLGVIARQYLPDFYGKTSSILHAGLPTDRLVAGWHLDSSRVQDSLRGTPPKVTGKHERVSVPVIIGELCRSDPQQAKEIQSRVRREFQQAFQNSYAVTGFRSEDSCGTYLLEKYED